MLGCVLKGRNTKYTYLQQGACLKAGRLWSGYIKKFYRHVQNIRSRSSGTKRHTKIGRDMPTTQGHSEDFLVDVHLHLSAKSETAEPEHFVASSFHSTALHHPRHCTGKKSSCERDGSIANLSIYRSAEEQELHK